MKKGFIVLEMVIIVWAASMIGYAIHKGVIEIRTVPPPCERVVDCGGTPAGDRN
jgi:hypothetical protein